MATSMFSYVDFAGTNKFVNGSFEVANLRTNMTLPGRLG